MGYKEEKDRKEGKQAEPEVAMCDLRTRRPSIHTTPKEWRLSCADWSAQVKGHQWLNSQLLRLGEAIPNTPLNGPLALWVQVFRWTIFDKTPPSFPAVEIEREGETHAPSGLMLCKVQGDGTY